MLDLVKAFLTTLGSDAGGMVVAVSGGPDSVALLRALVLLHVQPLVVCHLNHQLRGTDSDADEAFVENLTGSLNSSGNDVSARLHRLDIKEVARQEKGNIEGVARRLRYQWLAQVAQDQGLSWIATGHTADDQAETMLHRVVRGTGLQGLRGIARRRPVSTDIEVIRPILDVSRQEVLSFLKSIGQDYRTDQTNLDLERTRNRIRHQLLSLLARDYNPAIVDILGRLAVQAEGVFQDMDVIVGQLLAACEQPRAEDLIILDRQPLLAVSSRMVCEVFRRVWAREGWPTGQMNYAAWNRLAGLVHGESSAVDLPGGLHARRRERVVQVGPR